MYKTRNFLKRSKSISMLKERQKGLEWYKFSNGLTSDSKEKYSNSFEKALNPFNRKMFSLVQDHILQGNAFKIIDDLIVQIMPKAFG